MLLKRSVPSGNIIPTTSLLGDSPTQYVKIGIFVILFWDRIIKSAFKLSVFNEALPEAGGPMLPVWILKRLVSVFIKCLSLIVGFAVTVAIWPREVVSCRNFIFRAVATFWAMLLVGIYPSRASLIRPLALRTPCNEYCSIFYVRFQS